MLQLSYRFRFFLDIRISAIPAIFHGFGILLRDNRPEDVVGRAGQQDRAAEACAAQSGSAADMVTLRFQKLVSGQATS
jgi:hypothetical protein